VAAADRGLVRDAGRQPNAALRKWRASRSVVHARLRAAARRARAWTANL